jgi:hypothetical protein
VRDPTFPPLQLKTYDPPCLIDYVPTPLVWSVRHLDSLVALSV